MNFFSDLFPFTWFGIKWPMKLICRKAKQTWTQVTDSITNDDKRYAKHGSVAIYYLKQTNLTHRVSPDMKHHHDWDLILE